MNQINFYLVNPHHADLAHIRIRIRYGPGRYLNKHIGEKIPPSSWSVSKQRAVPSYRYAAQLNHFLDLLEQQFNDERLKLRSDGLLNKRELEKVADKILHDRSPEIYDYFQVIIDERNFNPEYSQTIGRKYQNVKDKLYSFDPGLTFDQINLDFFHRWTNYLYTLDISTNTVNRYVGFLKTFLREAHDRGWHENRIYENRKFAVRRKKVMNPYLSLDELQMIYKARMPREALENAKIELLKGCYSGLRHSDWSKLSLDNIRKIGDREYFVIVPQKTQGQNVVHIPAFPILKTLLSKRSYAVSNQKLNEHLKNVCLHAKIDQVFSKPVYKGNRTIVIQKPKHELVSSHIARRSFACNSIIQGVPARIVMQVGGWKSESSFRQYLQLSSIDGLDHFDGVFQ